MGGGAILGTMIYSHHIYFTKVGNLPMMPPKDLQKSTAYIQDVKYYSGFSGRAEDEEKVDQTLLFDYAAFSKSIWPGKNKLYQFEYDVAIDESAFSKKVGLIMLIPFLT